MIARFCRRRWFRRQLALARSSRARLRRYIASRVVVVTEHYGMINMSPGYTVIDLYTMRPTGHRRFLVSSVVTLCEELEKHRAQ